MAERRGQALAVLMCGAVVIGFAPILVRLTETGPAAAGVWRLAFALPLLALISRRSTGGPPPRAALIAGAMFALDIAFWHYGLALTSVANATVLSNLTPVVVTLVAWFAFGQRPRLAFAAAGSVAVAGAVLMALGSNARPGTNPALGDALSAATALWYAFYMLAMAAARRTAGAGQVMFWSSAVALPGLLAVALALREPLLPAGPAGWAACIGLGLVHVAGQGAVAWSLGRLPTALASLVVLIQPVVAAALGWILFQEGLSPLQALGGALALGGVILAQRVAPAQATEDQSPEKP